MARMADGTEIVSADQARKFFKDNKCNDLIEDIAGICNISHVEIDIEGDVWFSEPTPHWLTPTELVATAKKIPSR
jgi:hypothetical protein